MNKPMTSKRFMAMPLAERDAFAAQFNDAAIADESRPLTPTERKRWNRIKRKVGRPPRGKGSKVISVSIERGVLQQTDRLAKTRGVSRSQLIELGLRAILKRPARRSA